MRRTTAESMAYRLELAAVEVLKAFGTDSRLVDDIHFANHPLDVGFEFVADAMLIEIVEDVGLHLQFVRADEKDLHALEFGQQICERTSGASFIQFADDGDTQPVERALAVNRVQIEQSLGGMLPAIAVSRIDDGDGGNLGGALGAAVGRMANHDHIAVASR